VVTLAGPASVQFMCPGFGAAPSTTGKGNKALRIKLAMSLSELAVTSLLESFRTWIPAQTGSASESPKG
jgi:hypothetical protein